MDSGPRYRSAGMTRCEIRRGEAAAASPRILLPGIIRPEAALARGVVLGTPSVALARNVVLWIAIKPATEEAAAATAVVVVAEEAAAVVKDFRTCLRARAHRQPALRLVVEQYDELGAVVCLAVRRLVRNDDRRPRQRGRRHQIEHLLRKLD